MNNSVKRKSELNCLEKNLLKRMKENDGKLHDQIEDLEKFRKGNGDLIISLKRDNEVTSTKIKKCEVLKNISVKCKEMANIYQLILNSYDEQSQALDKIFVILKNK